MMNIKTLYSFIYILLIMVVVLVVTICIYCIKLSKKSNSPKQWEKEDIESKFKNLEPPSYDEILKRVSRHYSNELPPYQKFDAEQGTFYYRENEWINETATHSLKELKNENNIDKVTLVVKCNFVDINRNGYVRLIIEDPFLKTKTDPFKFKNMASKELSNLNGRIILIDGSVRNGKICVKHVARTIYKAS